MKQVLLYKMCELAGFEPAISPCFARRSLLCDHQPTTTCFTLQSKHQVVPNRGTA